MSSPAVSYVVPARNEVDYLGATLSSITDQDSHVSTEVIVADGDSTDGTRTVAREHGVRLVTGADSGIWEGRNRGAEHARGEWLAFVDADTTVAPDHAHRLLAFAREHDLDAVSSRCQIPGIRAKPMQWVINHLFPRLRRPVLPGFNFFLEMATFEATGGFPPVPNEDTDYSRQLGREYATGYCPDVLVETSPRRIRKQGLLGMTYHYLKLDRKRLRSER